MDWMTPEQRAWQIANTLRREAADREILRAFGVWRFCPKKPCKRQKACRGAEPHACLGAFGNAMPPIVKHWLGFQIKALAAGTDPKRIDRMYHDHMTARLEEERAHPSPFNEGVVAEIEAWLFDLERARGKRS